VDILMKEAEVEAGAEAGAEAEAEAEAMDGVRYRYGE